MRCLCEQCPQANLRMNIDSGLVRSSAIHRCQPSAAHTSGYAAVRFMLWLKHAPRNNLEEILTISVCEWHVPCTPGVH